MFRTLLSLIRSGISYVRPDLIHGPKTQTPLTGNESCYMSVHKPPPTPPAAQPKAERFAPNAAQALSRTKENKPAVIDDANNNSQNTSEFFHSPSTGLLLSRAMLTIDAPIKQAATKLGIDLEWDDEGRIHRLSFFDTRRLFDELGVKLMTPREYWFSLYDAHRAGDIEMVEDLLGKDSAEWLDVIFVKKNEDYYMIENPTIDPQGKWDQKADNARMIPINIPKGRYGWIEFASPDEIFDKIDPKTGLPRLEKTVSERKKDGIVFKYWDIFTDLAPNGIVAIRGYVTSSGTPSLDCGMPGSVDNATKLFVRVVRSELPEPPMDAAILKELNEMINLYDQAMQKRSFGEFRVSGERLISLLESLSQTESDQLRFAQEKRLMATREKLADMLGYIALEAQTHADTPILERISNIQVIKPNDVFLYENFSSFVLNRAQKLREALDPLNPKPIVFVMGHRNPDTDTVISSLFESYRQSLIDSHTVFIPIIQSHRLPDEVRELLDDDQFSARLLFTDIGEGKFLYDQARLSGQANWILVDHNETDVQKFVLSILDHHSPSETVRRQDVAKTIEIVGSTTGMVVQRFLGMGLPLSSKIARIALGATLMDTENRSESKMTHKDLLVMNYLMTHVSDIPDRNAETEFYKHLMHQLISASEDSDPVQMQTVQSSKATERLFNRDYKDEWGFGFAVAKTSGLFNRKDASLSSPDIEQRFIRLAQDNNTRKCLPLTLVKIVDYEPDNETVFQERMLFVFEKNAPQALKTELLKLFSMILVHEFGNEVMLEKGETEDVPYIQWGEVFTQLSRKKVAPLLKPIVDAFNEYFYSKELDLYIMKDFQRQTMAVETAAQNIGIELSTNKHGYINYISPFEAMMLMREMEADLLTPRQYAIALAEAKKRRDQWTVASLQSHSFVEVLGAIVKEYDREAQIAKIVFNPRVTKSHNGQFIIEGDEREITLLRAEPGLIEWDKVDAQSGFPAHVYYHGDDTSKVKGELARYWSPRSDGMSVFTRGSIFIYQIACLDGKVSPSEIQPNMGVRPCRKVLNNVTVQTTVDNGKIVTRIISDNGNHSYINGELR